MSPDEFEDLKLQVSMKLDPVELLDLLGLSMFDLVDALYDYIDEEQREKLQRELR